MKDTAESRYTALASASHCESRLSIDPQISGDVDGLPLILLAVWIGGQSKQAQSAL